MHIYPFGQETDLSTETAVYSAKHISLLNTTIGDVLVNIVDLSGNVVASFTMVADERLVITKPDCYTLSGNGGAGIKALPVIRTA